MAKNRQGPLNDAIVFRTHLGHHADLYLQCYLPSLRTQQMASASADEDDIWSELEGTYLDWAEAELLQIGYVSLYHLWEKQAVTLIGRYAESRDWTRPKRRDESLPEFVRSAFNELFGIVLNDDQVRPIRKAWLFANAFKHGPGRSMSELSATAPELIAAHGSPNVYEAPTLRMTEREFRSLVASLDYFWNLVEAGSQ